MKQIDDLSRAVERKKKNEVKDVVTRIKEAIATYGLTAAELGLGARRGPKPGFKRTVGKKASKAVKAVARIRDQDGNTWVGRGPRPGWLREALASGKTLGDSAV